MKSYSTVHVVSVIIAGMLKLMPFVSCGRDTLSVLIPGEAFFRLCKSKQALRQGPDIHVTQVVCLHSSALCLLCDLE
jgi:hypothetical protein